MNFRRSIDQNHARMLCRHDTIALLKIRWQPHRQAVEVTCGHVMTERLVPAPSLLHQARKLKMGLGKSRLTLEQSSVPRFRLRAVSRLDGPSRGKLRSERLALGPRCLRWQKRAIGLESGIVAGRNHQHDPRSDP